MKTIASLSTDELREELLSRSDFKNGLYATKARTTIARDPRPDLAEILSDVIVKEIIDRQKAIYGEDDRHDIYQIFDDNVLNNSNSVAAIFKVDDLISNDDGTVSLPKKNFSTDFAESGHPLCDSEPFQSQPAGAICTAFLVKDDIVATAGHCLNASNLYTRRFVFGYKMISSESAKTTVPKADVYAGLEIIGWHLDQSAADWALVKLDRKPEGRLPLSLRKAGKVTSGTGLYVIGHPVGLPQKYAANAEVRNNEHDDYFVSNLDTYGGNSGSPVFNSSTHEVEGILVRGETDFAPNGSCLASLICPVQGCRGEDCTRIMLLNGILSKV